MKNHLKTIILALLAITLATPALSYTVYPVEYGQHRVGAYTSIFPPAQGFYNYVAPPTALTRYGQEYHIWNLRTVVYPSYPYTYAATIHRPYFGYPYGIDRRASIYARSLSGYGFYRY